MQRTEKRGLNIIETSDAFSPEALNDNTRKIEAALDEHEAAVNAETAAISARVAELEGKKIVLIVYTGDGQQERTIQLGFTPVAALYFNAFGNGGYGGTTSLLSKEDGMSGGLGLVEGGILVTNNLVNYQYNASGRTYRMILFN